MQFSEADRDVLFEILRWRRDVRHFRSDPVEPDTLALLRRSLALAPSVGNSRPWRVVEVASLALRAAILGNHEACNARAAEAYEGERRDLYGSLKLAGLREAPVHLAVFTDLAPAEGHGLGRRTMPQTLAYLTVAAIHTLWLAARALNLGVGWVSILDADAVARLLGAEPYWTLTAYLCVGWPAFDDDTPELARRGWQEDVEVEWMVR
jgi:5,6-dimethylbenzimidazole synthase